MGSLELEGGDIRQQRGKRRRQQERADKQGQNRGEWYLPWFNIDPGSGVLVTGNTLTYTRRTQQSYYIAWLPNLPQSIESNNLVLRRVWKRRRELNGVTVQLSHISVSRFELRYIVELR